MNADADPAVLCDRLRQALALEPGMEFTKESARDAILAACLSPCMCARIPRVGGKPHTFGQYFAALYGETIDGKPVKARAA